MTLVLLFALILFTFSSAYVSASEIALFSLSSMRVKAYKTSTDERKRLIAKLLYRPRELFVTLFILNIASNLMIQNIISNLSGPQATWILKVGVPFVIAVLFGEIIPKYIAIQNNVQVAHAVTPAINFLAKLLEPFRVGIVNITSTISRIMFFFLKKEEEITRDEMRHTLETSQKSGVLHKDEAELIFGFLKLQNIQIKEIMQPKEDILSYDINTPLSKLSHLFVDEECTRLPVYDKEIDQLKGIIDANQYFIYRDEIQSPKDLQKHLSKPFFVPETLGARKLLRTLDERNEVFAIVVDEYSTISGLITKEDLVEVVTGDIVDKRDRKVLYTRDGEDVIIASGKLELSDFEEIFGIHLQSPGHMVTLGGWLTEKLGCIPPIGTRYQTPEFLFQVLGADPKRVRRIYVRRLIRE